MEYFREFLNCMLWATVLFLMVMGAVGKFECSAFTSIIVCSLDIGASRWH